MRILLVEDDEIISENIKAFLSSKGLSIDQAFDKKSGIDKCFSEDYDLLIIDRGLPDGEGLDIVSEARKESINCPILVLTARNQDQDIIEGFDHGADDYLSKPFDLHVLLARVKSLIRRGVNPTIKAVFKVNDITINTNLSQVIRNGNEVKLSPREYAIFEYLALHPNKVIDRTTLLTHAWDENVDLFSNTVDVHINYLRKKLGNVIKTIRGKGYVITQ
jgi:DNA-binding response OmpR family regulator